MADDRDKAELLKPLPFSRLPGAARPEAEVLWPSFADPYRAAGTAIDSEIPRLVVMMGKDGFKPGATAYYVLQYVHIGLGEAGFTAGGDQWFSYVFADRQPKRLKVEGTNILRICDQIGLHRQPWIRLTDRGFRPGDGGPGDGPVITSIEVTDWVPEQE